MTLFIHPPVSIDATGLATEAKQDAIIALIDGVEASLAATEAGVATLVAKDFATETTLATLATEATLASVKLDTALITGALDAPLSTRASEATLAALAAAASTEVTLATRATEATAQKLREWPYANYDHTAISWNAGTFTEVFTYKTGGSGGTDVGVLTVVYTDDTKEQTASVSYSPEKVV